MQMCDILLSFYRYQKIGILSMIVVFSSDLYAGEVPISELYGTYRLVSSASDQQTLILKGGAIVLNGLHMPSRFEQKVLGGYKYLVAIQSKEVFFFRYDSPKTIVWVNDTVNLKFEKVVN